jgi:tRNA(fMet)-specific endonuclease VapC
MILDTNALSAWLDGDKQLVDSLIHTESLELSSISLGEYRFGILNSVHQSEYENRLILLEKEFLVLAVTEITTRHYAEIRIGLKRLGRPNPFHDIWIAAQAREHNQSIISRDAHFDEVEGVIRISW